MDQNDNYEANRADGELTTSEREQLRSALVRGTRDIPSRATLVDVAEELEWLGPDDPRHRQFGIGAVVEQTTSERILLSDGSGISNSLDRVFDALGHPYRRRVLLLVADHNPRDEDEFAPEDVTADEEELELFTNDLYRVHLPKLDEAGYVEWDREAGTVRRGPNFDDVEPLLRLIDDHQDELPEGWP